jgi:hypothetical protein
MPMPHGAGGNGVRGAGSQAVRSPRSAPSRLARPIQRNRRSRRGVDQELDVRGAPRFGGRRVNSA